MWSTAFRHSFIPYLLFAAGAAWAVSHARDNTEAAAPKADVAAHAPQVPMSERALFMNAHRSVPS